MGETDEIPFYPKRDGKLTADRWEFLNILLTDADQNPHEVIEQFCRVWGINRKVVLAKLVTFRLDCPGQLQ